jgi:predicted nucleic acid-binding protein
VKALIDTNVALDAIAAREPFRAEAEEIILLAAEDEIDGYITASSVTDIYYVARKFLTESETRDALRYLFQVLSVLDVRGEDCVLALGQPMKDFEDALMLICAHNAGMECVISRDAGLLKSGADMPVISPAAFLAEYSG